MFRDESDAEARLVDFRGTSRVAKRGVAQDVALDGVHVVPSNGEVLGLRMGDGGWAVDLAATSEWTAVSQAETHYRQTMPKCPAKLVSVKNKQRYTNITIPNLTLLRLGSTVAKYK